MDVRNVAVLAASRGGGTHGNESAELGRMPCECQKEGKAERSIVLISRANAKPWRSIVHFQSRLNIPHLARGIVLEGLIPTS